VVINYSVVVDFQHHNKRQLHFSLLLRVFH